MLKIFNSLSGKKEVFKPQSEIIKMYVCGPTVYNEIHIGNARSLINFDLLYRVLKTEYKEVVYVRNITDIDDKIINRANLEQKTSNEIACYWTKSFKNNYSKLNVLEPTVEPLATENINEIIEFISKLIENDFAYISEKQVFFKINKIEDYMKLSKKTQSSEVKIEVKRIEENLAKEFSNDFILWKPSKENEPYWISPWGNGRPGWHIECSAMSLKYLGESFDIHGGGCDLMFPHHENERAQNIALNGSKAGPKYWMHNAMLVFNEQKMSKSLNNIVLLSDLFKTYNPVFIRFFILTVHYRHLFHWNEENLTQSVNRFDRWVNHLKNFEVVEECLPEVYEFLLNDLNVPGAFSKFDDILNEAIKNQDNQLMQKLANTLHYFGCMPSVEIIKSKQNKILEEKIEQRKAYRKNGDYVKADIIRDEILNLGYCIIDKNNETTVEKKFSSKIK